MVLRAAGMAVCRKWQVIDVSLHKMQIIWNMLEIAFFCAASMQSVRALALDIPWTTMASSPALIFVRYIPYRS